ncbi:LTA synthase family protein [Achromobacter sp. LC458]|uniref:LTA synthase family protein n=1 Tax=Achromobacter sp. LC458 TaxID=1120623 RepID=UPI000B0C1431|nr:LTA synthase family protein [Achromobacter sp. LC458]
MHSSPDGPSSPGQGRFVAATPVFRLAPPLMQIKRLRLTDTDTWQDWFHNVQRAFLVILAPWLVSVLAQFIGRSYLLVKYAPSATYSALPQDVGRTLGIGLLFDIKVTSIAFSALLLMAMLVAGSRPLYARWLRLTPGVGAAMAALIAGSTVVSVCYFATFSRSIDIFVFGMIDDDTRAILMTLWHGYPVVQAGVLLSAVLVCTWWLGTRWRRRVLSLPLRRRALLPTALQLLFIVAVTVLACRGSLGRFPLNKDDTSISTMRLLNAIAPNGISAFSWALREHGNDKRFLPATAAEGEALYARFLGHPVKPDLTPFNAVTGANPAALARPPHVVLQVMESMGHHLNAYDQPGRDLLGALRPHWEQDWRFDRFLSEGNGTIDSLARLLVRSPVPAIGQSSAADDTFASNAFAPYLARGYRVLFVTSGAATWRNLGTFATHLGAHEFIDQQTLRAKYPEAQAGTWGVPDEYMFRYIESRLADADRDGQPLFIVALSTTHHPPFIAPDGAQRSGLDLADVTRQPYFKSWSSVQDAFYTLRYANDQLGQFLTRVKASASGARTIIAVTGDHNMQGLNYQDAREAALARAVPFYLYVPQAYRGQSVFDPARVGGHKDILPTLYQLSLPATPYYRTGCDLLAAQPDPVWCFGINDPHLTITQDGAYRRDRPGKILPWANAQGLALGAEQPTTPTQRAQQERLAAYPKLMLWQINYQVQSQAQP